MSQHSGALAATLLKRGTALIISGPAASGKSTLARLLADAYDGPVRIIEDFQYSLDNIRDLGNSAQEDLSTQIIAVHTDRGSFVRLTHAGASA